MYKSVLVYNEDKLNEFLAHCSQNNYELISVVGNPSCGMYTIIYKVPVVKKVEESVEKPKVAPKPRARKKAVKETTPCEVC